jgi:NADP-dependent 3-hydroxy acid dehydrogenase YdfG
MTGRLRGKVALVTGASSGIGEATAIALAKQGALVGAMARRKDRLMELVKKVGAQAESVLPIEGDVSDQKQAEEAVKATHKKWGRLDILINNAGIMLLGPFDEVDIKDWERMVKVNVLGVMYCTHAAIPLMKKQKSGHIVNISSVAGRIAGPVSAVYNATKWGMGGFSEGLRQALAKEHIRMTLIEPGAVLTELTDHIPHTQTKESITGWIKTMTALESEDIANSIVYAVSQPEHVNVNEILIRPTEQER